MNSISQTLWREGFVRSSQRRILGGVCAGLGRRIGMGPWTARLLFVLVLFLVPGVGVLVLYPILWILMPAEPSTGWAGYQPAQR